MEIRDSLSEAPFSKKEVKHQLLRKVIRSIPTSKAEYERKKIPFFFFVLTTSLALFIIGSIMWTVYLYVAHFTVADLVGILASDLKKDSDGRTQILLLGTGGGEHDGADLTDTMMIASIDPERKSASLLSIPRDLWLELPGYGSSRVNKMYEILKPKYGSKPSLDILRSGIEKISNQEIPYYVKVDFEIFIQTVQLLGGITVTVEKSIHDTEYPNETESGYTTFSIEAGTQELDGATALKYVRSRHSTSDFDRSKRQQQVLKAMKEKAKKNKILSSPLTIKRLYDKFEEHVETNLKGSELISLSKLASDIEEDQISSATIHDIEVIQQGSFLYTPSRDLYGGAFVLIPVGESYKELQQFMKILFEVPEFFQEKASLQILNGTRFSGLAATIGDKLIPFGFSVEHYANAPRQNNKPLPISYFVIHHPEKTLFTEKVFNTLYPKIYKKKETSDPDSPYDISVVLGEDMLPNDAEGVSPLRRLPKSSELDETSLSE